MRPGRTTATHSSGLPFPLPIRVSAGFLVTGLSGNTRIQSFPPRLMNRGIARRAASICALGTQDGSSACRPYSPKAIDEPATDVPRIFPRCALRNLVRLGINIGVSPRYRRRGRPAGPRGRCAGHRQRLRPALGGVEGPALRAVKGAVRAPDLGLAPPLGQDVAAVDPDFHTDPPVGRERLRHAEIDVGPQRMQGDAALAVPLVPGDLRAGQPSAAGDADALGPRAQTALDRLLHGPAVGDAALQLLGDVFGNELGLEFGAPHLLDVHLDLLGGQLVEFFLQRIDAGAAAADDDARPRGVDHHAHLRLAADARLRAEPLDLHPGDPRALELLLYFHAHP